MNEIAIAIVLAAAIIAFAPLIVLAVGYTALALISSIRFFWNGLATVLRSVWRKIEP